MANAEVAPEGCCYTACREARSDLACGAAPLGASAMWMMSREVEECGAEAKVPRLHPFMAICSDLLKRPSSLGQVCCIWGGQGTDIPCKCCVLGMVV